MAAVTRIHNIGPEMQGRTRFVILNLHQNDGSQTHLQNNWFSSGSFVAALYVLVTINSEWNCGAFLDSYLGIIMCVDIFIDRQG